MGECLTRLGGLSEGRCSPEGKILGALPGSHYRAQADLARRLAEITVQPNVERELRYVAEELDHLANEIASDNTDFLRS